MASLRQGWLRAPASLSITLLALFLVLGCSAANAAQPPVSLGEPNPSPIGTFASYLPADDENPSIDEAMAAYRNGEFLDWRRPSLNFGIGANPVWIRFAVDNAGTEPLTRRVSVQTAWLDQIDFYVIEDSTIRTVQRRGDALPRSTLSAPTGGYTFDHLFPPGTSAVYLRVATPDPMVIPIRIEAPAAATARVTWVEYSYGILYGFLLALAAYNAMLYAGLREPPYLLYALYLTAFLMMNLSYSGHGMAGLWSSGTAWAQWSNPVLMIAYASSGLVFALTFLDTRRHFPRMHRAVVGFIAVGVMLLTVLIAMDWQAWALLLTFGFGGLFAVIMVALGMISLRAGLGSAQYFLAASVCAMTGVVLTELSVWGVIPFTDWAYRAVEIGMLLDATLLALALTYQFRVARTERAEAEALARLDPLTGINNRRAFYSIAIPLWNVTQRHGRDVSILIMDIDRFKDINDTNGHACGDEVLRATTQIITETMRDQDVAARWGGEEFIVLLPETGLEQATTFAERLRLSIAASQIQCGRRTIGITASFGVAARSGRETCLDELITSADSFLLIAKHSGRNRVRPEQNDNSESPDASMTP